MTFEPRLTAPTTDNRFYYKDNVFYKSGYGMPNCTCYAWGRFYELLNKLGVSGKPKLQTSNAENWYQEEKTYQKGQTPRLGSVIVWRCGKIHEPSDGSGHVMVVEEIYDNGDVLCSGSDYKGRLFYTQKFTKSSGYKLSSSKHKYTFDGFIYLPKDFTTETPIQDDTKVKELEAEIDKLNASLKEKDNKINGLNTYISAQEKTIQELNDKLNLERKTNESHQEQMAELQEENDKLKEEIRTLDEELKESGTYKDIYNITEDGIYEIDLKSGEVLKVC